MASDYFKPDVVQEILDQLKILCCDCNSRCKSRHNQRGSRCHLQSCRIQLLYDVTVRPTVPYSWNQIEDLENWSRRSNLWFCWFLGLIKNAEVRFVRSKIHCRSKIHWLMQTWPELDIDGINYNENWAVRENWASLWIQEIVRDLVAPLFIQ